MTTYILTFPNGVPDYGITWLSIRPAPQPVEGWAERRAHLERFLYLDAPGRKALLFGDWRGNTFQQELERRVWERGVWQLAEVDPHWFRRFPFHSPLDMKSGENDILAVWGSNFYDMRERHYARCRYAIFRDKLGLSQQDAYACGFALAPGESHPLIYRALSDVWTRTILALQECDEKGSPYGIRIRPF